MDRKRNDTHKSDDKLLETVKENEMLRALIRQLIENKLRSNPNKTIIDDTTRRNLRDEIRNELLLKTAAPLPNDQITSIDAPRPGTSKSIKANIGKCYKSVKNFITPKPVFHAGPFAQYSDDDSDDEQLKLAIAMSKESFEKQDDIVFNTNAEVFDCRICLEELSVPESITYGCEHRFCMECIREGLNTSISEGLIDSLKCPDPGCDLTASESLIKQLVPEDVFTRYEKLQLKAAVSGMDDVVYCPNCDEIIVAEIDLGMGSCHSCGHTFCTNCSKPFHGTTDCELTDLERQQMVQLYQDELMAEKLLADESLNELAISKLEQEDEERISKIREEQDAIRLEERMHQLQIEADEEAMKKEQKRFEQEQKQMEEERVRMENAKRQQERADFERTVRENERREREKQEILRKRRSEDQASENTIRITAKPCPSCRSPIEKNEGCIHMTCTKCRHEFCWGCMGQWSHSHTCR